MRLLARGTDTRAWVDGQSVEIRDGQIELASAVQEVAQVALRIGQLPGCYGAAAIPKPVEFECEAASMSLGDWSRYALDSYSGGAVYSSQLELTKEHLENLVELDLGDARVAAEVTINDEKVGVGLARPFTFDISDYCRVGTNRISVRVFNTLANHYSVGFPSSFVFEGQTVSGLLGPVEVRFSRRVQIEARILGQG